MKIRKNMVMRIVSATMILCTAISMAVFPSYAINADKIGSKGNIVLEDGEVALYGSDIELLQEELENLYSELPESIDDPTFVSTRKGKIKSCGIIDYAGGTVILDSTDLTYLADEIDELEALYKQEILHALNEINTFYEDYENIVHEENTTDYPTLLSLEQLKDGILNSQTVETGTIADNLTKDKGAWVNGEYITGNGNDANAAYAQGYIDGVNYTTQNANISYVYHQHTGDATGTTVYTTTDPGGCYRANGHTHNKTDTCTSTTEDLGPSEHGAFQMGCYCSTRQQAGMENSEGCFVCYECGRHTPDWSGTSHKCYGTHNKVVYKCGYPINTWTIGCGKTEGVTIDSATITFN